MLNFINKINWIIDKSKHLHRDKNVKSFFKALPAFLLVGSIFFFFVNWVSEIKRDGIGKEVERVALVVLKKIPTAVSTEVVSILPNTDKAYQSAVRAEEKAAMGDAPPEVDSLETQQAGNNLPSPSENTHRIPGTPTSKDQEAERIYSKLPAVENTDISAPPEEPDPASPVDYVIKKRKFSF